MTNDSGGAPAAPQGSADDGPGSDVFLETDYHQILGHMDEGPAGRGPLNQHVMARYYVPLQVYFSGSSFRRFWEPEEVVGAFFANRLDREGFFADWQRHGSRLRHWLMTSFKHFLFEFYREQKRAGRVQTVEHDESLVFAPSTEDFVAKAFAKSVVSEACKRTKELCEEEGLSEHWFVLDEKTFQGRRYRDIASQVGVTEAKARGMARTARHKFEALLRSIVRSDGATTEEIDEEIHSLMESLGE
ncbi:MAG: hypothetical protein AAF517_09440 [Planctomycetota bacterium]